MKIRVSGLFVGCICVGERVEQSNRLRDALKKLSRRPPALDLYNEMIRLNSELATAQRELTRRNVHLEQLRREQNELLGMVAHNLRNPIAALIGLSEHLLRDAAPSLAMRHVEMLEQLRDSSQHMFTLVEDLLSLATLEEGTLHLAVVPTDLLKLVRRGVRFAQQIATDKDVRIIFGHDGDARSVVTALDPHKITQALDNLLHNAVKFSHSGETIDVRLRNDATSATIAVEDHGVGIDARDLDKLFEPFRAGRQGTQGEKTTGLGLAIVRRIVRGHGGEVVVESALGVGTTFTVTLPLRSADPKAPPATTTPASPASAASAAARETCGRAAELAVSEDAVSLLGPLGPLGPLLTRRLLLVPLDGVRHALRCCAPSVLGEVRVPAGGLRVPMAEDDGDLF